MASNMATVTINLEIMLNGEPITHVIEAPAKVSSKGKGVQVYLDLDGQKLAQTLVPLVVDEITRQTRLAARTRIKD
jgi:hypothetical protein